ncbi:MAG: hypothetical protein M4579_001169 [Chaenotheca gracillima]|nr:MAG: hypothetical protein M4579_001169 [Chaenotheca gracillima]
MRNPFLGVGVAPTPTPPALALPVHPYYPMEAEIVGYLANTYSVPMLLSLFAAGCAAIFGVTLVLVRGVRSAAQKNPLSNSELATLMWFVLCGFIHFFFEGYFSFNHTQMGSRQDLFGQLWKEYSLSDSRYLTSDPFVLCMETITAVAWGPLSFVLAGLIATSHPLRHPLQVIVSLGQLYGDILYYGTSMFDHYYKGLTYCRPEGYYFWSYYFLMNIFWVVIPCILIYSSVTKTTRAFRALDRMSSSLQANGGIKQANGSARQANGRAKKSN